MLEVLLGLRTSDCGDLSSLNEWHIFENQSYSETKWGGKMGRYVKQFPQLLQNVWKLEVNHLLCNTSGAGPKKTSVDPCQTTATEKQTIYLLCKVCQKHQRSSSTNKGMKLLNHVKTCCHLLISFKWHIRDEIQDILVTWTKSRNVWDFWWFETILWLMQWSDQTIFWNMNMHHIQTYTHCQCLRKKKKEKTLEMQEKKSYHSAKKLFIWGGKVCVSVKRKCSSVYITLHWGQWLYQDCTKHQLFMWYKEAPVTVSLFSLWWMNSNGLW